MDLSPGLGGRMVYRQYAHEKVLQAKGWYKVHRHNAWFIDSSSLRSVGADTGCR